MILTTSPISIINKNQPELTYEVYDSIKEKYRRHKEVNYDLKVGDELIVISQIQYEHKEGFFFVVINNKNKIFYIDSNDIDCTDFDVDIFCFKSKDIDFKKMKLQLTIDFNLLFGCS